MAGEPRPTLRRWRCFFEPRRPPAFQVCVDALLDRLAHLVSQGHHQVSVFGRVGWVGLDVDGLVELDPPLAISPRQRGRDAVFAWCSTGRDN